MEYKHGVRQTPLWHELSSLDAAIEQYSQKAKAYYLNLDVIADNLDPEARKAREKELKDALKHLAHERRLAEVKVDVQTELEHYRQQGRSLFTGKRSEMAAGHAALAGDKHHPTEQLERFLRADGRPKPSLLHTAHHIVPGKGKTRAANRARLHIHRFAIRINDPDNGTWLVRKKKDVPHWSMPKSLGHLQYHTYNYETWVYESLRVWQSENAVRHRLRLMGRMLQEGNQPKQVTMPPDDTWDGK
jgi:hypothetical protein